MKGMLAAGVLSCLLALVQNTLVFCHTSDDLADYVVAMLLTASLTMQALRSLKVCECLNEIFIKGGLALELEAPQ